MVNLGQFGIATCQVKWCRNLDDRSRASFAQANLSKQKKAPNLNCVQVCFRLHRANKRVLDPELDNLINPHEVTIFLTIRSNPHEVIFFVNLFIN